MREIICLARDEKTVLSPAAPGAYMSFWFPDAWVLLAYMFLDKQDGAEESRLMEVMVLALSPIFIEESPL